MLSAALAMGRVAHENQVGDSTILDLQVNSW